MKTGSHWRHVGTSLSAAALLALGCGEDSAFRTPLGQARLATTDRCSWVPDEYIDQQDGCDCPVNGDTSCDPDCADNGQGSWCGCDYCFDESREEVTEPPPDPGGACGLVPAEYIDANDGCDCPADGSLACDPDCESGNAGGGYCGCEYCFPEEPPDTGASCEDIPSEYIDANDGCDCPADGSLACDPDCESGNAGGGYCGCEYCFPEEPPDPDPGTSEPGETHSVTLELLEGTSLCEMNLYAAETLTLRAGVLGAGASIGWASANIGSNSRVEAVASGGPLVVSSGANVPIASGSSLSGSVGKFVQNAQSEREVISWQVLVPPGATPDVNASASTDTVLPGRYGNVVVPSGSTLELLAGAYYFESLDVMPGGGLVVQGTSVVHVLDAFSFGGEVWRGENGELVVIYLGADSVVLTASIDGTLVAPQAALELGRPSSGVQRGAFFAKNLTVAANTTLSRLPANGLVPQFTQDAERCSKHVCAVSSADLVARERALALFCLGADDVCEAEMQARANVDYQIAAARVAMRQFTPARYVAVSRDRSRKSRIARASPGYHCAVTSGDNDADLVPNALDQCPATPELTPTDDVGCTQAIPAGPDPDQVAELLDQIHISVGSHCSRAEAPPAAGGLSAVWSMEPELTFSLGFDNGPDCPVFYELRFERRYALLTDPNGAPYSDFLQFVAPPDAVSSAAGGRVFLSFTQSSNTAGVSQARSFAHASTHLYLRYRVRAITPNGMKSPWSEWSTWTFKEY